MDRISLRKIVREIAANRSRTALTVLSIAVGLFAVSLTFRTQAILSRNVLSLYTTTVPAAIVVQVRPVDAELASTIRRVPGVRAVEGVSHISTRARVGGTWRALALQGIGDMPAMEVNRLSAEQGAWPAPRHAMLIERSYLQSGVQIGESLPIELENGRQYDLPIAGSTHDLAVISGRLGNPVLQGYISLDTAEWLTGSRDVNEFLIAVEGDQHDTAHLRAVADNVRETLRDAGCTVVSMSVRDVSVPQAYTLLIAVFQTLNVLGGLSLALSACLVVNTTSAMLARHVPQIGSFVSLIVVLLLAMALSFVAIGALSLVGALSLNVLERTREIGILRAIGSSHWHVASVVVIEGMCIGC